MHIRTFTASALATALVVAASPGVAQEKYPSKPVRITLRPAQPDTGVVFRKRDRAAQVEALANSGVEKYDIPAFLRKQAD